MRWLQQSGLGAAIQKAMQRGVPVVGICGGYQMLGTKIADPLHTESDLGEIAGLGLLPIETTFNAEKLTAQVHGTCQALPFVGAKISVPELRGYEIHMGQTVCDDNTYDYPIHVTSRLGKACDDVCSTARPDGLVWGTYMHGIFDNDDFRQQFLQALYTHKGLSGTVQIRQFQGEKEAAYNRLADVVRRHLDIDKIRRIMAGDRK